MSGWFQKKSRHTSGRDGRKKNLQESSDGSESPRPFLLTSDSHGARNPLDFSAMPISMQIKFPHWKDTSVPSPILPYKIERKADVITKKPIVNGTPDNSIPYFVMDSDTLISIALKFDTTPAEIARVNKKPFFGNVPVYPGELLYIPDSSSVKCPTSHDEQNQAEKAEEEANTDDTKGSGNNLEEVGPMESCRNDNDTESRREEFVRGRSSSLVELEEEVTDSHVYVSSKFMSNQLCVHGFLVINAQSVMFRPNDEDPLVEDNGRELYEVLLPLKEIVHSYITHEYSPPCSYDSSLQSPSFLSPKPAFTISSSDHTHHSPSNVSSPDHTHHSPNNVSDSETNASQVNNTAKNTDVDGAFRNESESKNENQASNKEPEVKNGNETLKNGPEIGDSGNKMLNNGLENENETLKHVPEDENENKTLKLGAEVENGKDSSNTDSKYIESIESLSEPMIKAVDDHNGINDSLGGADLASYIDTIDDLEASKLNGEHEDNNQNEAGSLSKITDYSSPNTDLLEVLEPDKAGHETDSKPEEVVLNGTQSPDQDVSRMGRIGNQSVPESETYSCVGLDQTLTRKDTLNSLFQESFEKSISSSISESGEEPAASPWYFLYFRLSQSSQQRSSFPLVGVEIPISKGEGKVSSSPAVQAVRTWFIFAIPKKSVEHIYKFLCDNHPALDSTQSNVTEPRLVNGRLEIINIKGNFSDETLLISESHYLDPTSSWEIFSVQDIRPPHIECMNVEHNLPLPNLAEPSDLLESTHIRKLMPNLVSGAVGHDWYPVYSTFKHGFSLHTLYRNMADYEDSPVLLVVQDSYGKLFGAMVSCPLRISDRFYGTGESFLFTFDQEEITVFPWIGENDYVIKGSTDSIAFGSGDGIFGLWLDEGLYRGSSSTCGTYHNEPLATKTDFYINGLEAWGFV